MASPYFTGLGKHIMSVFGEEAQAEFLPQIGDSAFIDVIFNEAFQMTDNYGVPIGGPNPVAWVLKADADVKTGDVLRINAVDYKIRQIEPDGHEMKKLVLSK